VGSSPKSSDDPDNEGSDLSAKVYFTRLHVRYNRKSFPQDLFFEETANTGNFQTRYIITYPATGDFSCEGGKKYLDDLKEKRKDELKMLTYLTGKSYDDWDVVVKAEEEKFIPARDSYAAAALAIRNERPRNNDMLIAGIGIAGLLSLLGLRIRTHDKTRQSV
jgi:hypothetical protein